MVFVPNIAYNQDTFVSKRNLLFNLGHFLWWKHTPDFSTSSHFYVVSHVCSARDTVFARAVESYQTYHGLVPEIFPGGWRNDTIKVDGVFGPETERLLEVRRCGCPDILPAGSRSQWSPTAFPLNVSQDMSFSGIVDADLNDAWIRSLDEIRSYGQEIEYRDGLGRNIHAHSRRIDGAGGVLAWSYLPGNNSGLGTSLEQRYDTGERWAGRLETFLRPVIIHELLHAFGLSHTNDRRSIMYPSMNGVQHMWNWEINEIEARYGKRTTPPDPPDPPTPPDPPEPDPGIIQIKDGQFQIELTIGGERQVIPLQVVKDKHSPV